MALSLFVAPTDVDCGKSAVCAGLFDALSQSVDRVGFLKPIGQRFQTRPDVDEDVLAIAEAFHLTTDVHLMNPVSMEQAHRLALGGRQDELLRIITDAHAQVARHADVVLVEGGDYARSMAHFEFHLSAVIADALEAKVLLVSGGSGGPSFPVLEVVSALGVTRDSFRQRDCEVIGAIVNKVPPEQLDQVTAELHNALKLQSVDLFGVVPYLPYLTMPKVSEVAEALDAEVIAGEQFLSNTVSQTITAAMKPHNMLRYLKIEGMLLIAPGDRDDAILAAVCSQLSANFPHIAGLVLTGGMRPNETIQSLLDGLSGFRTPVLSVKQDTFTASRICSELKVNIRSGYPDRISAAIENVRRHVDQGRLYGALRIERRRKASPRDFLRRLIEEARGYHKHIVFPEGNEPRTIEAVGRILANSLADVTLVGDADDILEKARQAGVNLAQAQIVNPMACPDTDRYAQAFYEIRKGHKNVTLQMARDLIQSNNIYFGTMMLQQGHVDGLICGAVHSTQETIRPAFQIIKARPDIGLASSLFFMALRDQVAVYSDCAIVVDPTAEELAAIAIASARSARAFGIEPYVAMLSYSTGTSGKGEFVDKVRQATDILRSKKPDFLFDGPIQYDAAVDSAVAAVKNPDSPVAGRANVFIFPDLDAGNIAYKAVQRTAAAIAVGPILQGLNKPVNDLSRGCVPDDIVYVTAVTAIQAEKL